VHKNPPNEAGIAYVTQSVEMNGIPITWAGWFDTASAGHEISAIATMINRELAIIMLISLILTHPL
jgi:hypothetical protein